eukprot:2926687-Prymnesium_polylepis.1
MATEAAVKSTAPQSSALHRSLANFLHPMAAERGRVGAREDDRAVPGRVDDLDRGHEGSIVRLEDLDRGGVGRCRKAELQPILVADEVVIEALFPGKNAAGDAGGGDIRNTRGSLRQPPVLATSSFKTYVPAGARCGRTRPL